MHLKRHLLGLLIGFTLLHGCGAPTAPLGDSQVDLGSDIHAELPPDVANTETGLDVVDSAIYLDMIDTVTQDTQSIDAPAGVLMHTIDMPNDLACQTLQIACSMTASATFTLELTLHRQATSTCSTASNDTSRINDCHCVNGLVVCGSTSSNNEICFNGMIRTVSRGFCCEGIPSPEVCDGRDNNLDGRIDDGLPLIECGVGACHNRVSACQCGNPQTCIPLDPTPETCDGIDNDCDGNIDNGCGDAGTGTD